MRFSRMSFMVAAMASVLVSGTVGAVEPVAYINGASNNVVGSTADLNGGNFPGKSTITLAITSPKGVTHSDLVVADAGGKVNASIALDEAGAYKVKANDSLGKTLASTIVVVRPAQR